MLQVSCFASEPCFRTLAVVAHYICAKQLVQRAQAGSQTYAVCVAGLTRCNHSCTLSQRAAAARQAAAGAYSGMHKGLLQVHPVVFHQRVGLDIYKIRAWERWTSPAVAGAV